MKRDNITIWLKRIVVVSYTYLFITSIIMYTIGYKSIVPDHTDEVYPVLEGIPPISQASIIKAVDNFRIQVPMLSRYPKLDSDMDKTLLGEAHYILFIHMCIPTIGPGAFTSWGRLGAVLAHEVEVHCNQNWWKSNIDEMLQQDPTAMLEREAYKYTLLDNKRFQLTVREQLSIMYVMTYHYPVGDTNEQRQISP